MAWNIELAFAQLSDPTMLEQIVPDVFAPTDQEFGFEDANSVMRDPNLSATRHQGWGTIVDFNCRPSSLELFLNNASGTGELFVFRISDLPVLVHGQQ